MSDTRAQQHNREFQAISRVRTGLDEILGTPFPVLDSGFVRVLDYMGGDSSPVQSARISYGPGTKSVNQDTALIRYLMRHEHMTPFESAEIKLHLKMPIYIARQFMRHRAGSFNELSARYSVLPSDMYIPDEVRSQSQDNMQGSSETSIPLARQQLAFSQYESYSAYEELLESGVSRETARGVLPLSTYTEIYAGFDLRNFMHLIRLRIHPHAQSEIRAYAAVLKQILEKWVPITAAAFQDYHLDGISLSGPELAAIRTGDYSLLSKREASELKKKLEVIHGL